MIPNNVRLAQVTSSMGDTEDFDMVIDLDAMPHLMHLLTTLYSDEELACLREYSTNAADAHFDAGQTRPIEVTTPTTIAPFLKIKDYGVGMNKETIRSIYCKYGRSTKREQTETNGSMGIGGKAALAYATQFTVIGVKDGIKTTVSVGRREDSTGVMSVLDESKTDEPNGTEIIIPTKAENNFDEKANHFFKFWAPGTVLVNGKEPDRSDMEKMTDRIYLYDGDFDVVVMGNVAYPLAHGYKISKGNGKKVAAFVTMNGDDEVVFVPSREELNYNGITKNAIMGIREEYDAALKEFIKGEVEGAANHTEAWRLRRKYSQEYGIAYVKDLHFKGTEFVDDLLTYEVDTPLGGKRNEHYKCVSWNTGRSRNAVYGAESVRLTSLDNSPLIIVDYKSAAVSSAYKQRIKQYMADNNLRTGYGVTVYMFSGSTLPGGEWTAGFKTVSWKTIMKETKVERVSYGGGFSYDGAYDVFNADTGYYSVEHLDTNDDIVFYSKADYSIPGAQAVRMLEIYPDLKIVQANANRHAKLLREFPNSREYRNDHWLPILAEEDFERLTDEDKEILRIKNFCGDYWERRDYIVSDYAAFKMVDKIEDPEYASAIKAYHAPDIDTGYAHHDKRWNAMRREWKKPRKFSKDYPLAKWEGHPKETLAYVNAIYNAKKEGN